MTAPQPPDSPISWRTSHGDVVTVWEASPDDWRWHVAARNGEVGDHGEGHTRNRVTAALAAGGAQ